jgi:hypothetical protein
MRKLLAVLVVAPVAIVLANGCSDFPTEPDATPTFVKPVPILIEDYDFLRMQFKNNKSTGELTIKITFKNMGTVSCSTIWPHISLRARAQGSTTWPPGAYVIPVCDEPGGAGGSETWILENLTKGIWEFEATLDDSSPDVDLILKQYTVR